MVQTFSSGEAVIGCQGKAGTLGSVDVSGDVPSGWGFAGARGSGGGAGGAATSEGESSMVASSTGSTWVSGRGATCGASSMGIQAADWCSGKCVSQPGSAGAASCGGGSGATGSAGGGHGSAAAHSVGCCGSGGG